MDSWKFLEFHSKEMCCWFWLLLALQSFFGLRTLSQVSYNCSSKDWSWNLWMARQEAEIDFLGVDITVTYSLKYKPKKTRSSICHFYKEKWIMICFLNLYNLVLEVRKRTLWLQRHVIFKVQTMLHWERSHHFVLHRMIPNQLEFAKSAKYGQCHLHLEICWGIPKAHTQPSLHVSKSKNNKQPWCGSLYHGWEPGNWISLAYLKCSELEWRRILEGSIFEPSVKLERGCIRIQGPSCPSFYP